MKEIHDRNTKSAFWAGVDQSKILLGSTLASGTSELLA